MASHEETAQNIREALAPFVRQRDDATHIRCVLRAHLAACLGLDDAPQGSLPLAEPAGTITITPEACGLQRAYLEALQANLDARRAFEQQSSAIATTATEKQPPADHQTGSTSTPSTSSSILDDHLKTVRLARKQERLEIVLRHLDILGEKPVLAPAQDGRDAFSFLQPEAIYADATRTLPNVPQAVLDSFVEEEAQKTDAAKTTAAELDDHVARLEALVLRSQLTLRREEQRLTTAKTRATSQPAVSNKAKLHALGVTRDALIAWMERELAATNEGADDGGDNDNDNDDLETQEVRLLRQSLLDGGNAKYDDPRKAELRAKLDEIRAKHADYVNARQALDETIDAMARAQTTTQTLPPSATPRLAPQDNGEDDIAARTRDVQNAAALGPILMAPYLEQLFAIAREQKSDLEYEAHYSTILARRRKETDQMLDRLAAESQLLSQFPVPNKSAAAQTKAAPKTPFSRSSGNVHESATTRSVSQRVAAWTNAADAAKLATLETVAEHLETSERALEQATEMLAEADQLLGRTTGDDDDSVAERDLWANINGELGLLNAEDGRRMI